jgi:hypothetical protein
VELFGLVIGIALYLLPAIIAHHRHHNSAGSILIINLFFGWSIIGWIICFAWACSGNTRQQVVILPPAYRR